jgi:hypothetical protein
MAKISGQPAIFFQDSALMNPARLTLLAFTFFLTASIHADDLKPIFDNQTLQGWVERGEALWEVKDGVITGRTGKGGHGWLCTDKTYGDFILEVEVRIEKGNSGVQIRSHFEDKDKMVGYQIEVDPSPRAWSGGLYEQGRRGWLQNLTNNPAGRAAFKVGEWNRYRVECRGDSIKSWVNGVAAADYVDSLDIEGLIALQVHSGKDVTVQFRNIRLQDLGRRKWLPLWDGKTMKGWHAIGKGDWTIADGLIAGKHAQAETEFGHLVTDRTFSDFAIRLKYKAAQGNSGLYFRVGEEGKTGVTGFQAEIDADKDAGGLYETNGRAWVVKPETDKVKKWFKPGDWNAMTVSAHGKRIAVDVNGSRTAELLDDPGRAEGKIALQLHGNLECEMYFKEIELLSEPR